MERDGGGEVTEMERLHAGLEQLESAWRRFLALDSTSANGATPPFGGVTHISSGDFFSGQFRPFPPRFFWARKTHLERAILMILEVKKLMGTKRGRDVQVEPAEICKLTQTLTLTTHLSKDWTCVHV